MFKMYEDERSKNEEKAEISVHMTQLIHITSKQLPFFGPKPYLIPPPTHPKTPTLKSPLFPRPSNTTEHIGLVHPHMLSSALGQSQHSSAIGSSLRSITRTTKALLLDRGCEAW